MISFQRLLSGDFEFSSRQLLYIMHLCGLVSLPGHYKERWKTQLQRFYTAFNLTLTGVFCLSIALGLLLSTIKEIGLFCERCVVFGLLVMSFCSVCFLNVTLARFIRIIDFFEALEQRHREKSVVVKLKNLEGPVLLMQFCMISGSIVLELIIYPLLPRSVEDIESLAKLYNLKHPHNILPFKLYIPYVDTSEPKIFYILFALFLYIGFLHVPGIVFNISLFPLWVFHLKTGFIILRDYTQLVGQPHFNSSGRRVYYTNLFDNNEVVVIKSIKQGNDEVPISDCQEDGQLCDVQAPRKAPSGVTKTPRRIHNEKHISHLFKKNPELYDSFYLTQIVQFQHKLLQQRHLVEDYFHDLFKPLMFIIVINHVLSMYASFMPGLPGDIRLKVTLLIISGSSFEFMIFFCGELLAGCNESLATALWLSQWWTCSRRNVRDMVLFLRMNQSLIYLVMLKQWKVGYEWMICMLKFAYSVFNVMKFKNQIGG